MPKVAQAHFRIPSGPAQGLDLPRLTWIYFEKSLDQGSKTFKGPDGREMQAYISMCMTRRYLCRTPGSTRWCNCDGVGRQGMEWVGREGASDIFIWAAGGNHMLARFPNFWLFAPELHWLQSKVWWFLASGVFSSAIAHTVALLAWSWIKLRWETRIKRRVKGTRRLAEGSLLFLKDIRASVSISFRQIGPRI